MSRTLNDRAILIKLASDLPKGSGPRRAILAHVAGKTAMNSATVSAFLAVAGSKLTQYDQKLSRTQPDIYRLGHFLGALKRVRQEMSSLLEDDSPEALIKLKRAITSQFFENLAPIRATLKQINQYLETGKMPSPVR